MFAKELVLPKVSFPQVSSCSLRAFVKQAPAVLSCASLRVNVYGCFQSVKDVGVGSGKYALRYVDTSMKDTWVWVYVQLHVQDSSHAPECLFLA